MYFLGISTPDLKTTFFSGQVKTSEITELTETMEITEKSVKQSKYII